LGSEGPLGDTAGVGTDGGAAAMDPELSGLRAHATDTPADAEEDALESAFAGVDDDLESDPPVATDRVYQDQDPRKVL
jgi:hypothetical protein